MNPVELRTLYQKTIGYPTRRWTTIELDGYENLGFLFCPKKSFSQTQFLIFFPFTYISTEKVKGTKILSVRFYRGTKDPQKARARIVCFLVI